MTWEVIAQLIIGNGLQVAYKLWQNSEKKTPPTQAEWDELLALGAIRARQEMALSLARGGIALDSEQGKAFLALTPV